MAKTEYTPQEMSYLTHERLKRLEKALIEQEIINQIHEEFISCLVLQLPEPKILDTVWRNVGSDLSRNIVTHYTMQYKDYPQIKDVINNVLNIHMNIWKSTINTAIDVRNTGEEKADPNC
ncbi:hypothetical protein EUR97_13540 [Salmonella enterica subsp. enterica serovar Muenchen]|nr:hypothetical protein [Salmonella enterica subsp. enterica serovar Muenchen]